MPHYFRKSRKHLRKDREFDTVPLGLGTYDPEYDLSLSDISEPIRNGEREDEERRGRHRYARVRPM